MQFENVDYRPFNVAKSYGHLASDGERSRSSAQEDRSAHEARSAGAGLGGGADSDTQNVYIMEKQKMTGFSAFISIF